MTEQYRILAYVTADAAREADMAALWAQQDAPDDDALLDELTPDILTIWDARMWHAWGQFAEWQQRTTEHFIFDVPLTERWPARARVWDHDRRDLLACYRAARAAIRRDNGRTTG